MPELFLEIGAEEIPSRFMGLALDYLKEEIPSFFKKNRIQASEPRVVGSPRRLVISFDEVDYQQEDAVETHFSLGCFFTGELERVYAFPSGKSYGRFGRFSFFIIS
jgi:glycyl-tRNA synthetase beta subunit